MSTVSSPPRALLSVYDKTGIVAFATALDALGFELLSTGGTARTLKEAGLPVTLVSTLQSTLRFSMAGSKPFIQPSTDRFLHAFIKRRTTRNCNASDTHPFAWWLATSIRLEMPLLPSLR